MYKVIIVFQYNSVNYTSSINFADKKEAKKYVKMNNKRNKHSYARLVLC